MNTFKNIVSKLLTLFTVFVLTGILLVFASDGAYFWYTQKALMSIDQVMFSVIVMLACFVAIPIVQRSQSNDSN